MEPALTAAAHAFGISGAVILALCGVVLYVVRAIIRGKLVPERYYTEALERGENYRKASDSLADQLRELTTNQDLALEMLTALRAHAEVKRGDNE